MEWRAWTFIKKKNMMKEICSNWSINLQPANLYHISIVLGSCSLIQTGEMYFKKIVLRTTIAFIKVYVCVCLMSVLPCCSYTTNCYHISLPWKAPKFGDREASLAPSLSPCQTPHLPYRGYKVPAKSGTLSTATFCKAVSNISRKRMCILPSANILLCTCQDAEHTIYVTSALSTV